MLERHDVVVVGAGLAGLRTARLLGAEGLSVLLADQVTDPGATVRTTGIFVRRTFDSFTFPPGTLGPAIRRVTLVSPAGRTLTLDSRHDEFRVGRMAALYAHELDQARRQGVAWLPRHRFEGAEFLRRDTIVALRGATGEPRMIRTRFVVGADGAFSPVAASLRLDRNRRWIAAVEDVLAGPALERLGLCAEPQLVCLVDPRLAPGYIAWAAYDGCELHVGAGGLPDRFQAGTAPAEARRRMVPLLRAGGQGSPADGSDHTPGAERRGGAIPVGGILERIGCIRGLLVGDAAGAPSPLTAGGLDPCFRLSEVAAHAVVQHLRHDHQEALRAYRGSRFRPRFTSRLYARRLLEALEHERLAEAGLGLLRLSPLRVLAREVFFGHNSFPDLAPIPSGPLDTAPLRPHGPS